MSLLVTNKTLMKTLHQEALFTSPCLVLIISN